MPSKATPSETTASQSSVSKPCWRCGEREATQTWGDFMTVNHGGGEPWCERCVVEIQTVHARNRAKALADLESRLVDLGGPARVVICGPVRWYSEADYEGHEPPPFGALCYLPEGHEGRHTVSSQTTATQSSPNASDRLPVVGSDEG